MRIESMTEAGVTVVLSKRNLLTLLQKVDDPNSHKTLHKWSVTEDGEHIQAPLLTVMVESDETHYDRAEGGPGIMHPDSEDFIERARRDIG